MILGETGTGKELLARELHLKSGRTGGFMAVNVAALPGSLMESELFGHVRGAFTGADRDRVGLVEQASGGTLFLDEIGDLPLPLQAKLLRVLQDGEIRRLGEVKTRKVDLRVVSATHRDLAKMVDEGSFRRDLLYRLSGLQPTLPPLRQRPNDLACLVAGALGRAALTSEARRAVFEYAWPGNIRELLSALEAARALAAPSSLIGLEHLPAAVRRAVAAPVLKGPEGSYRKSVADAKRRTIGAALEACSGNRTRAARMLGLSRQSLLYEMKVLGLAPPVHSRSWRPSGGSRGSRSSSGARRPSSSS
ncbi:MAG: sigma 54-interacting transcriptional regulator [Thermoanaerobaculia bacterium]